MSNGVVTQETVVREDPYTEAYKRGLFESVFGLVNQQMGFEQVPTGQYDAAGNPIVETRPIMDASGRPVGPAYAPPQQVAGMSPMQQQARALLQENLGAGQDYLRGGLGSVMRGGELYEQAAQQAAGTSPADPYGFQQRAATAIEGGMEAFDPSGIEAFFNPYEDQVVQQVQQDFDKARRMQEAQSAAQAVGSGAFGGSRAAIAEQEAMRNLDQAELNALGQLRQQGFGAAMTAAQNAQENQQRRALTGGSYLGNLGSTFGQLGQRDVELLGNLGRGIADLGGMQADLGVTATNLMRGDVSALSSLGGQDQMQQQNVLDAIRQTNVERQQFPFQQFGYLSDVLNRVPTNQSTMATTTSPQQSGLGQAIGYGIAGLGALAGVS
jgi:hypothetical protein